MANLGTRILRATSDLDQEELLVADLNLISLWIPLLFCLSHPLCFP